MIIKQIDHPQMFEEIRQLWNNENNSIFHIRQDLFQSQIMDADDLDYTLSKVVYEGTELIGFLLVKSAKYHPIMGYEYTVWISLFLIKKQYRNLGYGTKVIQQLQAKCVQEDYNKIQIGKDLHNILCGVPCEFDTKPFFIKLGFELGGSSVDMHKDITSTEMIQLKRKMNYLIHLSSTEDEVKIEQFFKRVFPGRWLYEYQEYLQLSGNGREFVIIEADDKVIAFCRINDELAIQNMHNRNWSTIFQKLIGVGPLGVDPDYRGMYLGYDVTAYAINEAVSRGASDIIIDWTSKIDFYKQFGFSVWKEYWSLSMDLKGRKQ